MSFSIEQTGIKDVVIVHPHIYNDFRGIYKKNFHKDSFCELGLPTDYSEVSEITSNKGALRGLHYQEKNSQAKLLHIVKGAIFDVALDLRPNSPTFGEHFEIVLSDKDNLLLFVPEGFAHGFLTLEDNTIFSYQCTGQYDVESSGGILWNDAKLNIKWPLNKIDNLLITNKDLKWPTFEEYLSMKGIVKK